MILMQLTMAVGNYTRFNYVFRNLRSNFATL